MAQPPRNNQTAHAAAPPVETAPQDAPAGLAPIGGHAPSGVQTAPGAQTDQRAYMVVRPVMGADGTSVPRMPGHKFHGAPAECEPLVQKGVLRHA
jgi:hypothetical protein